MSLNNNRDRFMDFYASLVWKDYFKCERLCLTYRNLPLGIENYALKVKPVLLTHEKLTVMY